MNIQKDTVVTLRLKISQTNGLLVEDRREPLAYLQGHSNMLPRIEAALEGQAAGYQTSLQLAPEDAFGLRDENLVQTIAKKDFPPGVKVGGELQGRDDQGQPHVFIVKKIKGDTVHLDGNHPLAGLSLRFDLKVLSVRAATAEELAHGHAHGDHGHHH